MFLVCRIWMALYNNDTNDRNADNDNTTNRGTNHNNIYKSISIYADLYRSI